MINMASASEPTEEDPPLKKLHQFNPKDVANELALLDAQMLRNIKPSELEGGVWMKKDKKHDHSPHVMEMVGMFNQLALLIPTEILAEPTPNARAKVITVYIQVASKCHSCHNYNSLKAVLAGLQCTPIFRLDRSWKEVPSKRKKRFQTLTRLMSEEENWQVYRKELEPKLSSSSSFIPFLGVFLTDVALSQEARSMKTMGHKTEKRSSSALYETYTLLEPITIRNKLEKLRNVSHEHGTSDVDPVTSGSTHSDSDREDNESHPPSPSPRKLSTPSRLPLPLSPLPRIEAVREWDVKEWLKQVGLEKYAESFIDNGYETIDLCAHLSGQDMTAIGITSRHDRSILHAHARRILENASCPIDPVSVPDTPTAPSMPAEVRPRLGAVKGKGLFSGTISGSLECLMSAVKGGGELRSATYEEPRVLVKSTSLNSLDTQPLQLDPESVSAPNTHTRTHSDTQTAVSMETGAHRRANSDTPSVSAGQLQSFSGLPPQLPLHSQSSHDYSPNKETKTKTGASPLKETSSKIKHWLQEHGHKGTFLPLRRRHKSAIQATSSPVLTQRPRRGSGTVPKLRASLKGGADSPIDLLSSYQFLSLSYCEGTESNRELHTVITQSPHNTEAQNYKISYQLEK